MEAKIAAVARAPDPGLSQIPASEPPAKASEPQVQAGPDPADVRLVIEEDQASGSYVYKTINRVTGEVIQQFPRADVLKLHGRADYAAGTVIDTEA
jgi:flagellar protein FlaG